MSLSESDRETRQKLKDDFPHYASRCLKIRKKDGGISPLELNKAQLFLHERLEAQKAKTGKVRAIILKGRQQGCSTYTEGRFYWKVTHRKGVRAFILTHEAEATSNLFDMASRFHEYCPAVVRPQTQADNAKELYFGALDSGYKVGTAGSKGTGRSQTVQYFHGCLSENTLIVLSDGLTKSIKDILLGDKIITSSGAIAPVSAKITTGAKEVFALSTWMTNESIEASADHKILTDGGWKKVSELLLSDYIALPDVKLSVSPIMTKDFALRNLERKQKGGTKHIENAKVALDYDAGFYFGYYLAEGHVKKQWGSDRHCSVSMTYHEDEMFVESADVFAAKYASSIKTKHMSLQHKKVTVYNGTFLAEMTKAWFGRVESKGIPEWVFESPKEFIVGLLDGYFAGDGSKNELDRVRAPSIHERISRQLKRLVLMVTDGVPSLHRYERERYGVASKPVTVIGVNGRAFDGLRGNIPKKYRNERFKIIDGKRFVKIRSIESQGVKPTYDIEVDHPDHDFETPIGIVSNSEVAFWPHAETHATGVMQAVPDADDTEVILESTANGIGNYFHTMWQRAEGGLSEYQAIFIPWFWQDEYRKPAKTEMRTEYADQYKLDDEQLAWMTAKIEEFGGDESQFHQEYPATAALAFQSSNDRSLISADRVMAARKHTIAAPVGSIVGGLDLARFGDDRSAFVMRQGRKIYNPQTWVKRDTMEMAGIAAKLIQDHQLVKLFIDVGGLGAGVVDRLRELGFSNKIIAVNSGEKPTDDTKYRNKRAEMWGEMKEWLEEPPIQIPDSDELHADLVGVQYKYDSNQRLVLESKDDMKKRGIRSPDLGDAAALTFAQPVVIVKKQMKVNTKWVK